MWSYNIHARAAGNVGPGQCTVSGLCLLSYRHMLPVLQSYNYPHFCGVNQGGAQPPAREKNVIMIQAQQRAPALHMLGPGPHPLLCAARVCCRVIAVPGCGGRPHLFLLDTVSYVTPPQHQHPAATLAKVSTLFLYLLLWRGCDGGGDGAGAAFLGYPPHSPVTIIEFVEPLPLSAQLSLHSIT